MKWLTLLLLPFIAVVIAGCGGTKTLQSVKTGNIPDWYSNPPTEANYLFATNTQTSQDMQLAIDQATEGGRLKIGRELQLRIEGLQKRFAQQTGTSNNAQLLQMFTQAEKTVVSTSLEGSSVKKQKIVKDGNLWRAYVLVQYPIGAANAALMQQIRNNSQMYTSYKASQAFKDLQNEVDKYEKYKKQQKQGVQ